MTVDQYTAILAEGGKEKVSALHFDNGRTVIRDTSMKYDDQITLKSDMSAILVKEVKGLRINGVSNVYSTYEDIGCLTSITFAPSEAVVSSGDKSFY
jgi:hypothetical protein